MLQKRQAMLDHEGPYTIDLVGAKAVRFSEADRAQPKLRNLVIMLNVNVRRLGSLPGCRRRSGIRQLAELSASAGLVRIIRDPGICFNATDDRRMFGAYILRSLCNQSKRRLSGSAKAD
jgi:hypothetical protein